MNTHFQNTLKAATLAGIFVAIPSCASDQPPEPDTKSASEPLFLGMDKWPFSTIPVCWMTPGYEQEKQWVQDAIRRTWESVALLDFVWTATCPTTGTDRFVKIEAQVGGFGGALIGPRLAYRDASQSSSMTIGLTAHRSRIEYVAVHEFGHILGFDHEQNSPANDPSLPNRCSPDVGPWPRPGTQIGEYDRDSVMNYCNSYGNAIGYLSERDRRAVRQVYGARKAIVPGDFNADGVSDFGVHKHHGGIWSVDGSPDVQWGFWSDVPVEGDYTGDGVPEYAFWREEDGTWWIRDVGIFPWGTRGDIPVPADYDGDGALDIAVYRPSEGMWYIKGQAGRQWGTAADIPVPADYLGTGKAIPAVWRPSTGEWLIDDPYFRAQPVRVLGGGGDVPVPGDYVGQGKAEPSVWHRPGIAEDPGEWWMGWVGTLPLGAPGDWILSGDFTGLGVLTPAVWRPSNQTFYVSAGKTYEARSFRWGNDLDKPLHGRRRPAPTFAGHSHRTFVLGQDENVYTSAGYGGQWNMLSPPFGRRFVRSPAAVSYERRYYDLFVVDDQGEMWHAASQSSGTRWGGWDSWGGLPGNAKFVSAPDATSWAAMGMHVFANAENGTGGTSLMQRTWKKGEDSGWRAVAVPFQLGSAPAATSFSGQWGAPSVDVVVVSTPERDLWHGSAPDGVNFTWRNLGHPGGVTFTGDPDIATHAPGTWDGFAVDTNGNIWHAYAALGGATGVENYGNVNGLPARSVSTFGDNKNGRLVLAAITRDGATWEKEWNGASSWGPWVQIHGPDRSLHRPDIAGW